MGRWGDGEMGRWGDGEMGRWGDGEMGRWGDGEQNLVNLVLKSQTSNLKPQTSNPPTFPTF
ncbi:MAG: hypothetical protein SW833_13230 [Cyanobacteriota bacterium]|nr:hypothetical protein [Cyanobacteriota bacterium]